MSLLHFKGRSLLENYHLTVPYQTLEENDDRSLPIPANTPENLIVHGDNLKALKALLPEFARRVDLIYIDPPYNTGNEHWLYSDNVDSPMIREWLGKEVVRDDLTRHDKWLCMMMPRLKLLRDLMSDNGLVFISIDDNEVYNLKLLLDDIFNEINFVACLPTVMNLKGNQDQLGFAGTHEYILVYAKDKDKTTFSQFALDESELEDWLEDDAGPYKLGANLKGTGINGPREKRPDLYFPIYVAQDDSWSLRRVADSDVEVLPITKGREMTWRWEAATFERLANDVIVARDDDGNITFKKKQRPALGDMPSRKPKSLFYRPQYSSGNGTAQLKAIFGTERVFDNPKPLDLIQDIIAIGSKTDSIVLDSFAGSATTGHAVLAQNVKDGGTRRFILAETEPYADSITAERVRRVIKGNKSATDCRIRDGYEAGFRFLSLGVELGRQELLSGNVLPTYEQLGKHLFFLATGMSPSLAAIDEAQQTLGEAEDVRYFLIYNQDITQLKTLALTVEKLQTFRAFETDKKLVIFGPARFVDDSTMAASRAAFSQIPYAFFSPLKSHAT